MASDEQLFKEGLVPHLRRRTTGERGIRLSLPIEGIADLRELLRAIDYGCKRHLCNPAHFKDDWIVDLTKAGVEAIRSKPWQAGGE